MKEERPNSIVVSESSASHKTLVRTLPATASRNGFLGHLLSSRAMSVTAPSTVNSGPLHDHAELVVEQRPRSSSIRVLRRRGAIERPVRRSARSRTSRARLVRLRILTCPVGVGTGSKVARPFVMTAWRVTTHLPTMQRIEWQNCAPVKWRLQTQQEGWQLVAVPSLQYLPAGLPSQ